MCRKATCLAITMLLVAVHMAWDTTAGATDHLRITLTLPTGADNTLQGQSSVIGFTFNGTQRAGTDK